MDRKPCLHLVAIAATALLAPAVSSLAAQIDVVLIAGQSNAAGRADPAGLSADPGDAGVEFFYHVVAAGGSEFDSGGGFVPLAPVGNAFGPEFGLARTLRNGEEANRLAIVKRARGGTNLFSDWSPGGTMYEPFVEDCIRALNLLEDRGDTVNVLGLAWHQGERDGVLGRTSQQYQADLNAFFMHVRQDLHEAFPAAGFENMRVAVGEVFSKPGISPAQQEACRLDGGARFVPTRDLALFDELHFDAPSQLVMGERMAEVLVALRDGELPEGETVVSTTSLAGPWFTGSASATAGTPSLSDRTGDTFSWGSGSESGGSSALRGMVWSYFPSVSLERGDALTLRFTVTYNDFGAAATGSNGFRFGFYDSNGSKLEEDLPNSNTDNAFLPSRGYGAMWSPTGTSSIHARNADRNNPLSTGASTQLLGGGAPSGATSTGVSYAAEIEVERDGSDQVTVRSSFNGESLSTTTSVLAATSVDSAFILNTPQAGGVNSLEIGAVELEHRSGGGAPPPPVPVRISEIFHDGEAQFVELVNLGAEPIELAGLRFTRGLVFTATRGSLAGGERVAITNQSFLGELAPSETLRLEDQFGRLLDEVSYGGTPDWPALAEHSFTLVDATDPQTDSALPSQWRASRSEGGSPGADDTLDLASWLADFGIAEDLPGLDSDGDGGPDVLEYAAGSHPLDPHSRAWSVHGRTLRYTLNRAAEDVMLAVQNSRDLRQWSEGELEILDRQQIGGGLEEITVGFPAEDVDHYARLVARGREVRPNVLFIAVDDLRPQLNAYGARQMVTPSMDRLAAEGRLFNRHYVQCPTCGASRYALMTSQRPRSPAAASNSAFESLFRATNDPANPNSLPQAFRFAGYQTVGLGKLSHAPDGGAAEMRGAWDESYMTSGIWRDPWDAFFAYAGGVTRERGVSLRTEIGVARDGVTSLEDTDYPDGLMAEEAIRRLREFKANGERFFFGLGFFKPHLPFNAPKKYWDLYDREKITVPPQTVPSGVNSGLTLSGNGEFIGNYGGPNTIDEAEARLSIHGYYACVSYVDAQIGKVLDELDTLGLSEETIVVLWGDHGWHLGEHTVWGKHTTLEESLRSTLIMRLPYQPFRGVATDSFAESIDLYPTLCELCGVTASPEVEGQSLAAVLRDPAAMPKDFALGLWRKNGTDGYSIRTERYRLVRWGNDPANPVQVDLFDYERDPDGKRNLSGALPNVVADLLERVEGLQ